MIYIIGCGLAGLSCGVELSRFGHRVTLFEAAPYPGGRCRSFYDKEMDCVIDNGNHLFLSGNRNLVDYLKRIKGYDRLLEREAMFYFMDLPSRASWRIHLNHGVIPWWIGSKRRRVPDTRLRDYLSFANVLTASEEQTMVPLIKGEGILYERFWRPLTLAVLNTEPTKGAASGVKAVLTETLLRGNSYSRPLLPYESLGASLIEPALLWLREHGGEIVLSRRIRGLERGSGRIFRIGVRDGKG